MRLSFGMTRRRGRIPFPATVLSAAGMWIDYRDVNRLFQDDAGATPVTAVGQTVGRVAWQGAAGLDVQATALSRPVWNGDRLTFDGTDDQMDGSGTPILGLFQNVSALFAAVSFQFSVLSPAAIFSWGEGVTAAQPRFQGGITGAGGIVSISSRRSDGDTTVVGNTGIAVSAGVRYVLMTQLDWTAQTLNVYLSTGPGSETQIGAFTGIGTAGVTSNTASLRQRLGANSNNATPLNGSIYSLAADAKLMTTDDRAAIRQAMWS